MIERYQLEDGQGNLLMEDGSYYLLESSTPEEEVLPVTSVSTITAARLSWAVPVKLDY